MKIKRTLVCDGGGMKGAFMAGVMSGLKENGIDYNFFDNYVGSSAGAYSIAYFLTDQVKSGLSIWTDHLSHRFISWKNFRPKIDVAYLEKIIRKIAPLNVDVLKSRNKQAYIALTNSETLETDYLSIVKSDDPIKLLMAGISIPQYAPPSFLDGKFYYDGGLTSQLPLEFADSLASDEIWVIMNRPKGYRVTKLGWKLLSFGVKDKNGRKLVSEKPKRTNDELIKLEARKDLVVICPKNKLPANWMTNDISNVKLTIEIGKSAAREAIINYLK